MCKEDKCEGTGCNGNGCGGKGQHGEQEKDGLNRFIVTGYVCLHCDTDFGMNEFGIKLKDGIHSVRCPVCWSPDLRVYHIVSHSEHPFPAITMCKEVLDYLIKDDDVMFDYRIPNDGHHGVDNACMEQSDFLGELLAQVKTCAQMDYELCMKNNFDCKKCEDRIPVNRDELVKQVIRIFESDPDVRMRDFNKDFGKIAAELSRGFAEALRKQEQSDDECWECDDDCGKCTKFDKIDTSMISSSITNFKSEPVPSVSEVREKIRKLQKRHIGTCGDPGTMGH